MPFGSFRHRISRVAIVFAPALGWASAACLTNPEPTVAVPNPIPEAVAQAAPSPTEPSLPGNIDPSPPAPAIETTDISILYPLPLRGQSTAFVRPTTEGVHGQFLPETAFAQVVPRGALDESQISNYASLAVIGLRLDPCYPKKATPSGCKSEVRVVFQAVSTDGAGDTSAADGALHVSYAVPEFEIREMLRAIQEAKAKRTNPSNELGPHPILAAEGLGGSFALRLRAVMMQRLGERRISRITFYDHSVGPNGDQWTFGMVDHIGRTFTPVLVPTTTSLTQTVSGSQPHALLEASFAQLVGQAPTKDPVTSLVGSQRPLPGTAEALALSKGFDAAVRVENPTLHNTDTTDCVNCHLAEGAHRVGSGTYGFKPDKAEGPVPARRDQRTSVSNLHAFGYLKREVSISQRTANESMNVTKAFFGSGGLGGP